MCRAFLRAKMLGARDKFAIAQACPNEPAIAGGFLRRLSLLVTAEQTDRPSHRAVLENGIGKRG